MNAAVPDNVVPEDVTFHAESGALALTWPDGLQARLEGPVLRAACRCAGCEQQRRSGHPVEGNAALLNDLQPVGPAGLALAFSDGHARGIYPWRYLRELAELQTESIPS